MLSFIRLLLSFLLPFVLGGGVLFLFCQKKKLRIDRFKFFIFSFALGLGLNSFFVFWFGLLGIFLLAWLFILFFVDLFFVFLIFAQKWRPWENRVREKFSFSKIEIILFLIIVFQVFFVFSSAALRPIINADAINNWAYKAKVFYLEPELAFNPSSDSFLGSTFQQNYPLHVPLSLAWSYFWMGGVNDFLVSLFFAFHFLVLIIFLYFSLRNFLQKGDNSCLARRYSLIFTFFLATVPLFVYHGFIAYSDLILTFYFTLASISLFNYFLRRKKIDFWGASFFIGLMPWIKNEGLILSVILLIIFLTYSLGREGRKYLKNKKSILEKINSLFPFFGSFLIISLPWLAFKAFFGLGFDNVYSDQKIIFTYFHPEVLPFLLRQVFVFGSFHLWPGLFLFFLFFFRKKIFSFPQFYLLLIIVLGLLAYLVLYFFTASFKFVIEGTIVGRNLMVFLPLSIYLVGLNAKQLN